MDLNYRFKVWGPTGTLLRTILRDDMTMRSTGFWARVAPEGDGIEANFTARGSTTNGLGLVDAPNWGIPTLSAVQIEYEATEGELRVWRAIYYGQVRQGGNPRDVQGENYVLRSLLERLKYVTLSPGFSTPEQAAHLTIQAAIQDVRASGQLGTPALILYDAAQVPDLGFNARAIEDAAQQTVYSLLEQLQQDGLTYGVTVRLGVNANRTFYARAARTDTLTLSAADVAGVVWRPPVAETPCTRVLWHLGMRPGRQVLTQPHPEPVTVLSERMANDPYGVWTKALSVAASVPIWTPNTVGSAYEYYNGAGPTTPVATITPAGFSDGVVGEETGQAVRIPGTSGHIRLVPPSVGNGRVVVSAEPFASAINSSGVVIGQLPLRLLNVSTLLPGTGPVIYRDEDGFAAGWAGTPTMVRTQESGRFRGWALGVLAGAAPPDTAYIDFRVSEFRAEIVNQSVLDGLAKFHYSVPEQEPADLTLNTFLAPGDLAGSVSYGTYSRPVSAYEYRVNSDRGLTLNVLTGPPGDPSSLAQASLIKARDQKATLDAVTAQR